MMNNYGGRDPLKNTGYQQPPTKPHTDDRTQTPEDMMEMMEMQPLGVNVERGGVHGGMGYSGEEPVQSYPVEDDYDTVEIHPRGED